MAPIPRVRVAGHGHDEGRRPRAGADDEAPGPAAHELLGRGLMINSSDDNNDRTDSNVNNIMLIIIVFRELLDDEVGPQRVHVREGGQRRKPN